MGRADKSLLLADHHVGVVGVASLRARAWVHVLEPFQLELILGGLDSDLLTHGVVSMDLRIRHPDAHGALRVRSLLSRKGNAKLVYNNGTYGLLPMSVLLLEVGLALLTVVVSDDAVHWRLRSVGTTEGIVSEGHGLSHLVGLS